MWQRVLQVRYDEVGFYIQGIWEGFEAEICWGLMIVLIAYSANIICFSWELCNCCRLLHKFLQYLFLLQISIIKVDQNINNNVYCKKIQKVAPKSTKQPSNTSIPNLNLQQYQKQQKITQQKTMATKQFQTSHLPPNTIKLPKITFTKVFRIRSASKQKNQQQNNQKLDTVRDSSGQKFRSNSLKLSNMNRMKTSTKIVKKKSEEDASGYDESVDVGSCRFNSKYSNQNNMEAMEKEHQRNMQKLTNIAKMFDPKTLMRLGSKNSQNSQQENNPKENKNKHMKGQIRVNQYIFEGKYQNKNKNSKDKDVDEYWKKVNESLILAPCKTMENEVSKDLREIFQTLVTE